MRDIAVSAVIFGSLPFILWRPYIGVLVWTWISFMNPHRLTWGFAYDMPFALIVALVTLVAMLTSREPKKMPWTRETIVLLIFLVWMLVTTIFSVYPELAWPHLDKVAKILLMVYVTLMLMQSKERINQLVWVVALSLAFYGVKGGIFTIANGGVYHVRGPEGSFIGGDNEMGLALVMTIPLLRYLQLTARSTWLRLAMTAAMLLTAIAAIGSQSRGAMLGIAAMGVFLWLKSRSKVFTAILGVAATVMVFAIMPQQWFDRMSTIGNYQQDYSAMGRINAWHMAFNLAKDRPLGGGFDTFQRDMFYLVCTRSGGGARLAQHLFRGSWGTRFCRAGPVPVAGPDDVAYRVLGYQAREEEAGEEVGRRSHGHDPGKPDRLRNGGGIPRTGVL